MSLTTHSRIFYGYEVTADNQNLDFDEGGPDFVAVIEIGSYTLTEYANAISSALNDAGALTYTVSVDRTTRKITIAASGTFNLQVTAGAHLGTTGYTLAGFTTDRSGSSSYLADTTTGSEYVTQFIPQSHISEEDNRSSTYGSVNKSASGRVEVVSFGTEEFVEFELMWVNDYDNGSSVVRTDLSGVAKLRALMRFLITKAPIEFMPDEDDVATFTKLILESTPDDSKGLNFRLKEQYDKGLPGYFNTGVLKFRVQEQD